MSGTGLDHPLVLEYLDDLDRELARRLTERAGQLRAQISARLTELLPPGADDDAIAAALAGSVRRQSWRQRLPAVSTPEVADRGAG